MSIYHRSNFHPLTGLRSPHLQMFVANFVSAGKEPPSQRFLAPLPEGDQLCCEISTPLLWKPTDPTIALIHGLGGSHRSSYMIRLAQKFFHDEVRVVRINLRGCGSGALLSRLPYHSGNSPDIQAVLERLKEGSPKSPITLIGFSLGGNIALKLGGELGKKAGPLLNRIIAVCPVLDLKQTVAKIEQPANWIYHRYYLKGMIEGSQQWAKDLSISSIYEFDEMITAPFWGYTDANDYYKKCSSHQFIEHITIPCDLLLAKDDPFIDYQIIEHLNLPEETAAWLSSQGGHMGFIGWAGKQHGFYWMDKFLLELSLVNQDQTPLLDL